ncbi:hypothetical protein D3C81_1478170 [compost metagenome]
MQRFGLPDLARVQRLNAAQHVAHLRGFGRVDKTMLQMPTRQGRQMTAQGADRQGVSVLSQVTHDAVTRRWEKPTPADLKMRHGLFVAARGAFPPRRLQVPLCGSGHPLPSSPGGLVVLIRNQASQMACVILLKIRKSYRSS